MPIVLSSQSSYRFHHTTVTLRKIAGISVRERINLAMADICSPFHIHKRPLSSIPSGKLLEYVTDLVKKEIPAQSRAFQRNTLPAWA